MRRAYARRMETTLEGLLEAPVRRLHPGISQILGSVHQQPPTPSLLFIFTVPVVHELDHANESSQVGTPEQLPFYV